MNNIGIDISSLGKKKIGGGEYFLRNLCIGLNEISNFSDNHRFTIFYSKDFDVSFLKENKNFILKKTPIFYQTNYIIRSLLYFLFFPIILKINRIDLIFYAFPTRPIFNIIGIKSVGIIYDIQDKIFLNNEASKQKIFFNDYFIQKTLNLNDTTFCISENSKKEILSHYKSNKRLTNLDAPIRELTCCDNQIEYKKPFFLYVGSLHVHKNVITILKSYLKLRNMGYDYDLYIVGAKQTNNDSIKNFIQDNNLISVHMIGSVTETELYNYYKSATLFLFPSLYEGFGMPLVEAMFCKTLILTTKESCIKDVTGNFANYVDDPLCEDKWTSKIIDLINNLKIDSNKLEEARKWALGKYHYKNVAKNYIKEFDLLLFNSKT